MAKRIGFNVPEIPRPPIMRWMGHKNLVTTNRYTLHRLQALMGHKDPKTTQRYRIRGGQLQQIYHLSERLPETRETEN